jgi:predicted RNase H-like HicB family nuclease
MQYWMIYEQPANDAPNWCAYVPDLPGCVAVGDTYSEVASLIREAIALHLEGIQEDHDPIPSPAFEPWAELVEVSE